MILTRHTRTQEVNHMNYREGREREHHKGLRKWSQTKAKSVELMYTHLYSPICIKVLKNLLHMKKKYLMRIGKIVVSCVYIS